MLRRVFKGIYHFTVYAIGILVLTAAVMVTLIRLVLPDIGIYRSEVEAWVSNYMGYPVVIHTLNATWEGWVPYLELSDIDLLNRAGTQPITHFDSANIRISPLETVLKRRIVPKQLTIRGFELAIARLSSGAIYIEGVNVTEVQATGLRDNELAEWLFKQEQIRIENASIEWLDIQHEQEPVLLSDVSLALRSDGKRLQAEGSTRLPELYGKTMDFYFDATGDLLSADWSGELYLSARDINPDNWYRQYRPLNFNVSGGNANLQVWSSWEKARLASLEGKMVYNDFGATAGNNELHVSELDYRFFGKRVGKDGWQFYLNLDNLRTVNGNWPETSIMLSAERAEQSGKYRYTASFDFLKLDDFSPFIRDLKFLPDTVKEQLADFSVAGHLSRGKLIYDPQREAHRRLRFDTYLDGIETDFGEEMPTLTNLSGHAYGYLDHGVIDLDTRNTTLDMTLMDMKPLHLDKLQGAVAWNRNAQGWSLHWDDLRLSNEDLLLGVSGSIRKSVDDESPFMDILAQVDESRLEVLPDYLPWSPKFKFRDWMERTVLGGTLKSATALLRGRLKDFPFDEHNGRFQLITNTENTTLDYSSYWPPVDELDVELILDGRQLVANIGYGKIFNATISDAIAGISDFLKVKKSLSLEGRVQGQTRDLSLFIAQSPLQKDPGLNEVGESFKSGNMSLDLDMLIPLKQPGVKPDIDGTLELVGTSLTSRVQGLRFDEVNGVVAFTESSVQSGPLTGKFAGKLVDLGITGSKLDADKPPAFSISARANQEFVTDRLLEYFPAMASLEHYFRNRMEGETDWTVTMTNLPVTEDGKVPKRLDIKSSLKGMTLDFPAPLGKTSDSERPLAISSYLGLEKPGKINIVYDDVLHTELVQGRDRKLDAINMALGGAQQLDTIQSGLNIFGAVESLNASRWWGVIKENQSDKTGSKKSVLDAGVNVDLDVTGLELLGHRFDDVALTLRRPAKSWDFTLEGGEISGDIHIPVDRSLDNSISFALDKLVMNKSQRQDSQPGGERLRPENIPAIQGNVRDFIFNEFELGEMNLATAPTTNGLAIEKINFKKKGLDISGAGDWNGGYLTDNCSFNIELHAEEMEQMLTTFNYNETPVRKGETRISMNANWLGSPMDFSLDRVNGSLNMEISKGQLLDVNPSAGRLFGLFSLQTLSRRLTLDFSDIFGKGLAFDRIEGSFDIDDGNAYTNDLYMRGPSANVAVSGRTGLSEQDYDQIVTVTPQLSDNLPVAGVLLGPVGIGVGAVFYLAGKMFDSVHDSIDKILSFQYTITGSWDDPVIEKIKQRKNEQKFSEAAG